MGAGMAASILVIQILRERPGTRVAMIESSTEFPKKVGESFSDVTALFFNRFNVDSILNRQVKKTGLRFIFHDQQTKSIKDASDYSSPSILSIANGRQVNRSTFDGDLLKYAEELGAEVIRPAHVMDFNYSAFNSTVTVKVGEEIKTLRTTWLVDSSGRAGIIAKKWNWRMPATQLMTASSWAHFENVKMISSIDGDKSIHWNKWCIGDRHYATTHFMGEGYWVWTIPLSDNTVSIGIVYDQRILKTNGMHPKDFFFKFVKDHPSLSELTSEANGTGFKHYPHLPYTSRKYREPGMAMIGDAAAFVDPLFSPGMEFNSQQSLWLAPLILDHLNSGHYCERSWSRYEKLFAQAFEDRILLYEKRYALMGDQELYGLMTQLDFAGYYTFVIHPSVLFPKLLRYPARFNPVIRPFYNWFRQRMLFLYEKRKELGITTRVNHKRKTFSWARVPQKPFIYFYALWLSYLWLSRYVRMELAHLIHSVSFFPRRIKNDAS
jgi:flavin-dependent dehydrogenase